MLGWALSQFKKLWGRIQETRNAPSLFFFSFLPRALLGFSNVPNRSEIRYAQPPNNN